MHVLGMLLTVKSTFSYQESQIYENIQGTGLLNAMGAAPSWLLTRFHLNFKMLVSYLILVVLLPFRKIPRTIRSEGCESPEKEQRWSNPCLY